MPDQAPLDDATAQALQLPPGLPKGFINPATATAPEKAAIASARQSYDQQRAPMQADVAQAMQTRQQAAAAGPKEVPVPDFKKPEPAQLQGTFAAMMVMAALSGRHARVPATAALNAMNGVLKGMNEGNQAEYEKALKEYDINAKKAIQINKQKVEEYNRVINNLSLSVDEKSEALRQLDLKYGRDEKQLDANLADKYRDIGDMNAAVTHASDKHQQFMEHADQMGVENKRLDMEQKKLDQTAEFHKEAAATAPLAPETIDYYAKQSLAGDNSWQAGLARGKVGQRLIAAVKDRIPQLAKQENLSPEAAAGMKGQREAINSALKDRTKYLATATQFVSNFDKQAELVDKYLDKGAAGSVPVVNKWIQAGRKAVAGDPDVVAFDTAIRGLAREHQRIVTGVTSNAQLHVAAQETADELLNRAETPEQIRSVLKVMHEEAKNAVDSGEGEVDLLKTQLQHMGGGSGGGAPTKKTVHWDDLK